MITKALFSVLFILIASAILGSKFVFLPVDILNTIPIFDYKESIYVKNSLMADPVFQFEPWRLYLKESFKNLSIPLWNDKNGGGAPFIANMQNAAFYPLNFFNYILPTGIASFFSPLIKLLLLAWFSYLYFKSIGLKKRISFVGGVAASTFAFPIVWIQWPHLNVFILFPLFLIYIEKFLILKKYSLYILLLALTYFVAILGGHPETLFHVTLILLTYVWLRTKNIKMLFVTFYGLAVGILLGSFLILPFIEYLLNSWSYTSRSLGDNFHFLPLSSLIYLIFPFLTGAPHFGIYKSLWDFTNFHEYSGGFVSLPFVLLSFYAIYKFPKINIVKTWIVILVIAFLLAYKLPFISLINELPILNLSANQRMVGFMGFAFIVLGSFCLDRIFNGYKKPHPEGFKFLIGIFVSITVLAFALLLMPFEGLPHSKLEQFIKLQSYQVLIIMLSLIFFIFSIILRKKSKKIAFIALITLVVVPVAGFFAKYNPTIKKENYYPENEIIKAIKTGKRIIEVGNPNFPENLNLVYGVEHAQNYDALEVKNYRNEFDKTFPIKNHWGNPDEVTYDGLKKFGIDTVISDYDINFEKIYKQKEKDTRIPLTKSLRLSLPGDDKVLRGFRILTENYNRKNDCSFQILIRLDKQNIAEKSINCNGILNNMFYTVAFDGLKLSKNRYYDFIIVPKEIYSNNFIALRGDNQNLPYIEFLYERNNIYNLVHDQENLKIFNVPNSNIINFQGSYEIVRKTPENLVIKTQSTHSSSMEIKKTNFPGWKATIDGSETVIESGTFIKLNIPAGIHIVNLYYLPLSFWVGTIISSITLSVLAIYGLRLFIKSRKFNQISNLYNRKISTINKMEYMQIFIWLTGFMISGIFLTIVINKLLPAKISLPFTTSINWLTINNHSLSLDYFRIMSIMIVIPGSILLGWIVYLWKRKK